MMRKMSSKILRQQLDEYQAGAGRVGRVRIQRNSHRVVYEAYFSLLQKLVDSYLRERAVLSRDHYKDLDVMEHVIRYDRDLYPFLMDWLDARQIMQRADAADGVDGDKPKRSLPDEVMHPRFVRMVRSLVHQGLRNQGKEKVRVPSEVLSCMLLLSDLLFRRILKGAFLILCASKKRTILAADFAAVIQMLVPGLQLSMESTKAPEPKAVEEASS